MRARIRYFADLIQNSYWFVPGLMTLAAVALSVVTVRVDANMSRAGARELGWVFTGGPEGARAVLSTIAGSMITVAGVVFSITIVALTLASSQFGPRVLRNFMRDRGNQLVLGTFIATFLYCLLILRNIRSIPGGPGEVPYLSVTVGLGLAVVSLGVLIFFIHHVSISIQAPHLIATIAQELHASIDELYPEEAGMEREPPSGPPPLPATFERESALITSAANGYVEAVDLQQLMEIAGRHDLVLRLEHRPGNFVTKGAPLVHAWPRERVRDEAEERIADSFVFGSHRTSIQDVEFSVNQLVEIAVRALSPGINDPFTAVTCIDQLSAGLCHLSRRHLPSPYRFDGDGKLRLVLRRTVTYAGVVDAALNQIRQNASYHAAVYIRLLEALAVVAACAEEEERLDVLLRHAEMIVRHAMEQVPAEEDRAAVKERLRAVVDAARPKQRLILQAGD